MPADRAVPNCGFLSTYPPTQCGLASFTASLRAAIVGHGTTPDAGVVRVVDRSEPVTAPEVVHHHRNGSFSSLERTVDVLNGYGVALIQHEYGIYGGADGDEILEILGRLRVPAIVVLHTVLLAPTPHQRYVTEEVARAADMVVTMTRSARRRLLDAYKVDAEKVVVIPHGSHDHRGPFTPVHARPTILTWGLLGPGKGIEHALEAIAMLSDLEAPPRYVVAGETHPKVREHAGEAYREALVAKAAALGIEHQLVFETGYRDLDSLGKMIRSSDVVLLPYDSREQVTSGVLIEAVTAGRPVIATAFPHAVELLGSGAGLVVPHENGAALSEALRRVLTEDGLADEMSYEANRLAPQMLWSAVAAQYLDLADRLMSGQSFAVA